MIGVAGVAAAGAAALGMTPTLAASPQLAATVHYLSGTNIGDIRPPDVRKEFAEDMLQAATGIAPGGYTFHEVPYPGGFWPVSTGGFNDPTWNQSVAIGLSRLVDGYDVGNPPEGVTVVPGDTIVAFSQGAVVASQYKTENPGLGISYVLIENPTRPNGGLLPRFAGLYIPILDVSFSPATPSDGDLTVDIARQYSGWSDFPTYPVNLLATANAIAGIYYLHGDTQDLDETALDDVPTDDPDFYQEHGNTKYYLIPTQTLPILMPFKDIAPDLVAALDPPLRYLVELGYDRGDYSAATPAKLLRTDLDPVETTVGFANSIKSGLAAVGLTLPDSAAPSSTGTAELARSDQQRAGVELPRELAAPQPKVARSGLSGLKERKAGPLQLGSRTSSNPDTPNDTGVGATPKSKRDSGPAQAVARALKSLGPKASPGRERGPNKPEKASSSPAADTG